MVYELGINYMVKQFFHVSEGAVIRILLRNSKRESGVDNFLDQNLKYLYLKIYTRNSAL